MYREEGHEIPPFLKACSSSLYAWTLKSGRLMFNLNHQHLGVGCIPLSPLAKGVLTRPRDENSLRAITDG